MILINLQKVALLAEARFLSAQRVARYLIDKSLVKLFKYTNLNLNCPCNPSHHGGINDLSFFVH